MPSDINPPANQQNNWQKLTLSLFVVLLVAKIALAGLRAMDGSAMPTLSAWLPFALLREDAWLVAVFCLVTAALRKFAKANGAAPIATAVFGVLATWTAINVPVARVFGTPLTWRFVGATDGALLDAIAPQVKASNIIAICTVLAIAVRLPRLLPNTLSPWLLAILAVLLVAPLVGTPMDTLGLQRNAVVTLVRGALPQPDGCASASDARLPAEGPAKDFSDLSAIAKGRNVLWVVLESTGARSLRPWGAAHDAMPRVTQLAERAWVFDSIYSATPESILGLFAMLCAISPVPHADATTLVAARRPQLSVAESLQKRGYRTGLFHSGRFVYLHMGEILADRGFDVLADAAVIGGPHARSFGTDDASTARATLQFIDGVPKDQPFFAMWLPIAGHYPYHTPGDGQRPLPEKGDHDRYLNDLHVADDALGLLLDGLQRRGLMEKTLIIIVGDHGEAFAEHPDNIAHSLFVWEENVHVPLLVVAPGIIGQPWHVPQVGGVIDLAPTVLNLLGIPPQPQWQGRSLLAGQPGVARFFADYAGLQVGLRQDHWKMVYDAEADRAQLFDLTLDPLERVDLAGKEPQRTARYRVDLLGWLAGLRADDAGATYTHF